MHEVINLLLVLQQYKETIILHSAWHSQILALKASLCPADTSPPHVSGYPLCPTLPSPGDGGGLAVPQQHTFTSAFTSAFENKPRAFLNWLA